jgi:hypothetical protein
VAGLADTVYGMRGGWTAMRYGVKHDSERR